MGHGRSERRARVGWAEASRGLAEAGGDVLAWPEFGNVEDESLGWSGLAVSRRRRPVPAAKAVFSSRRDHR